MKTDAPSAAALAAVLQRDLEAMAQVKGSLRAFATVLTKLATDAER